MAKLTVLPKKFDLLDANDPDCIFRINIDVINECFGANRSLYMNACYPQWQKETIAGTKDGDRYVAWMPKLYHNSSEWKNRISPDGKTITEVAEETRKIDWKDYGKHPDGCLRLVFVKPSPKEWYRFVGVFKDGEMNHLNHTYKRIATKVRLIGNPVAQIELLDDER